MRDLVDRLRERTFGFAAGLAGVLLVANAIALPGFADPAFWPGTLAAFAPFALAAIASTPAILSGGLDISVGPLLVLVNAVMVAVLLPRGLGDLWVSAPILLALGAGVGALNGLLVGALRYPAVIATLCTLFVVGGAVLRLVPQPVSATPNWTDHLAGGPWPIVVIALPLLVWTGLRRTPLVRTLLAVGADPVAAFSAGVPVARVRVIAYTLGGLFAAVGGIALTALVRSTDASLANQYILIALAAVAFGGTPLTGGRGGLVGSLLGAACIFLIQNLLNSLQVSAVWLQIVYGGLLIAALLVGSGMSRASAGRPA